MNLKISIVCLALSIRIFMEPVDLIHLPRIPVKKQLEDMSSELAQHGVTTFVPTVVSAPHATMVKNLLALTNMMEAGVSGADPDRNTY